MGILKHVWGESPAADRVWAQVAGMSPPSASELRIMVLQAYIDDSVDAETGVFVLAGYVSTAEKWAKFSKEWEERLPLSVIQTDGRYRFKMSEMANYNRWDYVPAFHALIAQYAEISISCVINKNEINDLFDALVCHIILANGERIYIDIYEYRKALTNPFWTCFRIIMENYPIWVRDNYGINEKIDFYFDLAPEKKILSEIWDQYKLRTKDQVRDYYGREPRFEDDEDFLPLQAADYRAWWIRKWAVEFGFSNISNWHYPPNYTKSSMHNVVFPVNKSILAEFLKGAVSGMIYEAKISIGEISSPDYLTELNAGDYAVEVKFNL